MATDLKLEISKPKAGNLRRITSIKSGGKDDPPLYGRPTFASSYDGHDPRRNSTGKPSSINKGEHISPHYLRASTGSCHDFCKHGRHESQEDVKRPLVKKTPPSQTISRSISLPSKKVLPVVKPKPVVVKKTSPSKTLKENEIKVNVPEKKLPVVKPKPVTARQSSTSSIPAGLNARRISVIKSGEKTITFKAAVKKTLPTPTISLIPKSSVLSLNARTNRSNKLIPLHKDKNGIRKTEPIKQNGDTKVEEKILHVVEHENEEKIVEPIQIEDIIDSHSYPPLPISQSSHEDDLEDSEYTDSEDDDLISDLISENDEVVNMDDVETLIGDQNTNLKQAKVAKSEDKDCKTAKLKFRRGEVIDPQSEKNGSRKLRFRRGTVLGENEKKKSDSRRTFKKRAENETNSANHDSEKIVLRHQDVQGKKEEQGLFNNVIEETASKLVESRKSKVKALVGAFESVISLQEGKPNTQNSS